MKRASRFASAAACAAALVVGVGAERGSPASSAAGPTALAEAPIYSSLASQRIYFVMPDRYANGDPSNDRGGLAGSRLDTGFDPTDPGWFHGGDLKGLTGGCTDPVHGLIRIRNLGFTALWITPVVKQQVVDGPSAGYHGYWGLDFTTVDPHFGTDADFRDFADCAHRLGLKVYLDVVVNHTGDVIRLGGSVYVPPSQEPYRNCHGKPFDPGKYVTRTFPCLNARNMPQVPSVPTALRNVKAPAWLNNPLRYHDRGDIDFGSCSQQCFEQGDFFGLDDLFTEQPVVVNGLAQIYASWISRYHVDGFRVDTAKHVNAAFFRLWVPKILAAARGAGIADFPIFGEVTLNDDVELSSFVRNRGLPSVLDFPFQDAAVGFASGASSPLGLRNRLADDDYFRGPSGVAPTPPTFLGNHDMGRGAYEIQRASHASGDELLRRVLLGYDLLYLLRGAPVVSYGDEVGMVGTGGDQQARQDMFPTQVPDWRTQERVGSPPVGTGSSFDVSSPVAAHLRELGALRDAHPALSTGASIVRLAAGKALVVSRIDASARREYVAAFNAGTETARLAFPTSTPSSAWSVLLGAPSVVTTTGAGGELELTVPPLSSVLLRADVDLPASAPARPALRVGADDLSDLTRLTATVPGSAPVSVTFVAHRGKGAWFRLATDDSPPYRAFLDPARYKRNERLRLVAVARSLDGRTSASKTVVFRVHAN